jgi:hypothetical protein
LEHGGERGLPARINSEKENDPPIEQAGPDWPLGREAAPPKSDVYKLFNFRVTSYAILPVFEQLITKILQENN